MNVTTSEEIEYLNIRYLYDDLKMIIIDFDEYNHKSVKIKFNKSLGFDPENEFLMCYSSYSDKGTDIKYNDVINNYEITFNEPSYCYINENINLDEYFNNAIGV